MTYPKQTELSLKNGYTSYKGYLSKATPYPNLRIVLRHDDRGKDIARSLLVYNHDDVQMIAIVDPDRMPSVDHAVRLMNEINIMQTYGGYYPQTIYSRSYTGDTYAWELIPQVFQYPIVKPTKCYQRTSTDGERTHFIMLLPRSAEGVHWEVHTHQTHGLPPYTHPVVTEGKSVALLPALLEAVHATERLKEHIHTPISMRDTQ